MKQRSDNFVFRAHLSLDLLSAGIIYPAGTLREQAADRLTGLQFCSGRRQRRLEWDCCVLSALSVRVASGGLTLPVLVAMVQ